MAEVFQDGLSKAPRRGGPARVCHVIVAGHVEYGKVGLKQMKTANQLTAI